jgi:Flp pilus assembly protein TadD
LLLRWPLGLGAAVPLTRGFAEMFDKQEEWEQTIGVYMQGLIRCEDARLRNGLGYCLDKACRLRQAEHHHGRAVELAPDVAAYANDVGYVLLEQGELQQARVNFERALHLDPAYELARNNLSLCSKQASEPR